MTELEKINNKDSKYKAVNVFIFCGSFSIGVMKAGFNLDRVLEISDKQLDENAYYFHKNFPSIPVVLPKEWENDEYLDSIKDVDAMFCNCPCSSLSQINRYAKIDGAQNVNFYRYFNVIEHVKPKVLVFENAPTLIKLGFPILRDCVDKLGDDYRFTIIRDLAGNHQTPMRRQRTVTIGWRRDVFDGTPVVDPDTHPIMTVKDAIGDLYDNDIDDFDDNTYDKFKPLFGMTDHNKTIFYSISKKCLDDPSIEEAMKKKMHDIDPRFDRVIPKLTSRLREHRGFWDHSPYRLNENAQCLSLTGLSYFIHPIHNRMLNRRELARIMGYPDDFDVSGKCKIFITQALAQGVPVNFAKHIATQVYKALEGVFYILENNCDVVFQNNMSKKYDIYTRSKFMNLNMLATSKDSKDICE